VVALAFGAGVLAVAVVAQPSDWGRYPLSVTAARADAIANLELVSTPDWPHDGQTVEARVVDTLKGQLPATLSVVVVDAHGLFGGVPGPWRPGLRLLAFLGRDPRGGWTLLPGDTVPFSEAGDHTLRSLLARLPRWSPPQGGLATILLPDRMELTAADPMDLWMGYRNDSGRPLKLAYRDWPPERRSYWTLEIRPPDGRVVTPLSHPHVSPEEIKAFFSQHGNTFSHVLAPGESFFLVLDRINSAEPGWGYKERLGFRYYPLVGPGRYEIRAQGHRFGPAGEPATRPLMLDVRP